MYTTVGKNYGKRNARSFAHTWFKGNRGGEVPVDFISLICYSLFQKQLVLFSQIQHPMFENKKPHTDNVVVVVVVVVVFGFLNNIFVTPPGQLT